MTNGPRPPVIFFSSSHLRVYMSLVQQLSGFHEMHLALRGGHGGREDEAVQTPRVSEGHHAVLRPASTVRDLFLVHLVTVSSLAR